jgi:hypothetical protein
MDFREFAFLILLIECQGLCLVVDHGNLVSIGTLLDLEGRIEEGYQ